MSPDVNEFAGNIISALDESSFFDKDDLAERLGLRKEELEAALREYFFGKSFAVRAYPNYGRLGLKSVTAFIDFSFKWAAIAPNLLDLLTRNGFLVTWKKPFGGYTYITHHAVPPAYLKDYYLLFDHLVDLGVFSSYKAYEFEQQPEAFSYSPSVFDYRNGDWKEGIFSGEKVPRRLKDPKPKPFNNLDEIDLSIIDQLQHTSLQTQESLAKSINLPIDVVSEHLQEHVIKEKLILKYVMDIFNAKLLSSQTAVLTVFCNGMSKDASSEAQKVVLAHPYTVYVNLGEQNVEYDLQMPWRALSTISRSLDKTMFGLKPAEYNFHILSLSDIFTYTIPLRQCKNGKWSFNEAVTFDSIKTYLENNAI